MQFGTCTGMLPPSRSSGDAMQASFILLTFELLIFGSIWRKLLFCNLFVLTTWRTGGTC